MNRFIESMQFMKIDYTSFETSITFELAKVTDGRFNEN